MTDGAEPTLEDAFQDRLLAAIAEIRRHTRLGTTRLLEDIQRIGALEAAKKRLHLRDPAATEFWDLGGPGAYFLAAKRAAHIELSIEAIVLEPKWEHLFTPAEREEAAAIFGGARLPCKPGFVSTSCRANSRIDHIRILPQVWTKAGFF